jgi:hypothetical protein
VSATTDAERQTRVLRSEVEELQRKRDGIMAQMGQLRDIVSTFAPTTNTENSGSKDTSEAKADKPAADEAKSEPKAEPKADEAKAQEPAAAADTAEDEDADDAVQEKTTS